MDSDEDTFDNENVDSGNVSSGDDDFGMEVDAGQGKERTNEPEEYPYEVLTTEQIVQHMVDSIKEVNTVVEVSDRSGSFRGSSANDSGLPLRFPPRPLAFSSITSNGIRRS